jgi:LAO/AO transport system kinase
MLLCEAAGFDVVIVETVGIGQSEAAVAGMVDFFLVLTVAGAGDMLQGIKRGVLELADMLAVNKADGDNVMRARPPRPNIGRPSTSWSPPRPTGARRC